MRVLVAVEPLMYREAIAQILLQRRPRVEVRIAGPEDLDQEVESFLPHLVVCNVLSEKIKGTASSWVHILYEDSLDAHVSVDALSTRRINDIRLDDLLGVLDETEELIPLA